MEKTRLPSFDYNFATYREDLNLPSLEDMRVYWHTQMLAAQRYMTVINENYSLALHLHNDLRTQMLEADIRKDFSSQRPHVVGSSKDPYLSWSDIIRGTDETSFTDDGNGLFSCCVRGHKVQMPAQDRKQVRHYSSLSVVHQLPKEDIRVERDTISEVRTFISQCKKDREEGNVLQNTQMIRLERLTPIAAKFEEKLDDLLIERDYQLRELQQSLKSPLRSELPSHNISSRPTELPTGHGSGTSLPPQPSVEPVIIIDSDDLPQPSTTHHQTGVQNQTSSQPGIDACSIQNVNKIPTPPQSNSGTNQQLQSEIQENRTTKNGVVMRTEGERLHATRFLNFLHERGVSGSSIPTEYERRFKVSRSQGSLAVKYYRQPHHERVSSGCVALSLRSRPRLKALLERLSHK